MFLGEKAFDQKKVRKRVFLHTFFLHTGRFAILEFLYLVQLSFLDLNFLYIGAAIPNRRINRRGGGTLGW